MQPNDQRDEPKVSNRGVILFVEDHEDSRVVMSTLLRAAEFDVHDAASAESALAKVDMFKDGLDVLIVDYNLGGEMTGTDVAEELARRLGYSVPTIILTGDPANAEVPMLRFCPVCVARKPLNALTLIAGLHPLVTFRRAMKRIGGS